uniref:D-xylose 1-dehydrogenase (NADP(+), D-xylono-1,5-lactone-forming) n=1 Tax=Octactis speculum TaxID=3111310 RepID=A0A7S2AN96_9STRA|mmetsp:Transcript_13051/g.17169  ORF Transcript_13051/g.17169 Transcript_13051/m.17169 type:complete len:140 (+) Transcript_13051:25-444(+)
MAAVLPAFESATQAIGYIFPFNEVRWGIIGVGDVCEKKAGPGLYKSVGSSLQAVMRRTKSKAEEFAQRHDVPAAYDSVDDLLGDTQVNAVYIASPVGNHLEHALAAAAAGKPTLLEKPIARCEDEAQRIVQAFAAARHL